MLKRFLRMRVTSTASCTCGLPRLLGCRLAGRWNCAIAREETPNLTCAALSTIGRAPKYLRPKSGQLAGGALALAFRNVQTSLGAYACERLRRPNA